MVGGDRHQVLLVRVVSIGVGTGGATGSPTFQTKLFLKSFFLKHKFYTKTIYQDEEITNLRRNPS